MCEFHLPVSRRFTVLLLSIHSMALWLPRLCGPVLQTEKNARPGHQTQSAVRRGIWCDSSTARMDGDDVSQELDSAIDTVTVPLPRLCHGPHSHVMTWWPHLIGLSARRIVAVASEYQPGRWTILDPVLKEIKKKEKKKRQKKGQRGIKRPSVPPPHHSLFCASRLVLPCLLLPSAQSPSFTRHEFTRHDTSTSRFAQHERAAL